MCAQVSLQSLVGDAHALAKQAMSHPGSAELSARDLAALLVVAGRTGGGLYREWPKCLAVMTGLLDPAAAAPAKQLLQELVVPAA